MTDARNTPHDSRETGRITARLRDLILERMPEPGDYPTAVQGFVLHRRDVPHMPENCFHKPILAITVQGAKRTVTGGEEYRYGEGHSLLAGVDMPSMSYITDASPQKPYLVVSLELDQQTTSGLVAQLPPRQTREDSLKGSAVSPTDPEILKAFLRLAELLNQPEHIPVLAPLILQEIHLRLLLGAQGALLRALSTQGTRSNRVFQGINWLRENFRQPLDVDALAVRVHMAPSTFRKHFKLVTSMSPTAYHKHLQLYDAQRLMVEGKADATRAAHAVGYESLSQFNREYKRLFGTSPAKDARALR